MNSLERLQSDVGVEFSNCCLKQTAREKIACKTHLKSENYCFKHIFGILFKFPIQ